MRLHARGDCNGKFAAAPQYGISVLARNVVFADPWLGRRGIKTLWQPDAATGIGLLLGIGLWSGALALCALLLRLLSNAPYFLQALGAMWRPLVLVLAAAYLLFSNDQGRELGVSLMARTAHRDFSSFSWR
jgi:hypothetical protein